MRDGSSALIGVGSASERRRPYAAGTVLALCLVLAACGKPDVEACESYIKEGLASPATYRREEVTVFENAPIMTPAQYYEKVGLPDPIHDRSDVIRTNAQLHRDDRIRLRSMFVRYSVSNAYGVPVRGTDHCVFKIVNDVEPTAKELDFALANTRVRQSTRELVSRGLAPPNFLNGYPNPHYDCCLPGWD